MWSRWAQASILALMLLSRCLLSASPPGHEVQDPRPVYSTRAKSERLMPSQGPSLEGTRQEKPGGQSCPPRYTGGAGPPEPNGHLGNFRHQGRLAGAVMTGLGLSCQGFRLPLQLVEKETVGGAQ